MDLRIVNTCNNNCAYCLEQSYRVLPKFADKNEIFKIIASNLGQKNITFYGGNPLLHTDLLEIVGFAKENGYDNISILTNTFGLSPKYLNDLISSGLTGIGFYFNSFNEKSHDTIVNSGISLKELLDNINLIKNSPIYYKAIIHINNENIKTVYKDINVLNKKYQVSDFEFVNYFPFDRPFETYGNLLGYSYNEERAFIDRLFAMILHLKLNVRFLKFGHDFFGKYKHFYDFERGILDQIGPEDLDRLMSSNPFCLKEQRCSQCFIKDNCKFHKGG